ncbi:hypothetical protein JKP88DRAFT_143452, partial [Tribonema minus]
PVTAAPMVLQPVELADMVCGPPGDGSASDFNFRETFHITEDSDFQDVHELRDAFWEVVDTMMVQEKWGLLLFITGVRRLPPPKTELMAIELQYMPPEARAGSNRSASASDAAQSLLGRVPCAHTCDNVLEVPDYWTALVTEAGFDPKRGLPASAKLMGDLRQKLRKHLRDKLLLAIANAQGYGLDGISSSMG